MIITDLTNRFSKNFSVLKPNKFEIFLGTGFYSGYSPIASGTTGSLVALLFLPLGNIFLAAASVLFFIVGIKIGDKFEAQFGKDPGIFVLDEFVGTWIAFLFIDLNLYSIIFIFLFWRFFDILKPFPVRNAEKLNGGLGIMLDDAIAGIYANLVWQIIVLLIK